MATGFARAVKRGVLDLWGASTVGTYGCRSLHSGNGRRFFRQRQTQEEVFPQRLVLPENHGYVPTLSPNEVTSLLTINEAAVENKPMSTHPVRAFESNQLPSNHPLEDRRAVARMLRDEASLFGVFDGHAGSACAQSACERLFDYISIALLPQDVLEDFSRAMRTETPLELLQWFQFNNDYIAEELQDIYRASLVKFVHETLSMSGIDDFAELGIVAEALRAAFIKLDSDISAEAMPAGGRVHEDTIATALSGSCACTAHVAGLDVHVANIGDTRAVVGQLEEDGTWVARPLTTDHNVDNMDELERVKNSHPVSESNFVIKNNRLLGQLIPLRAFGDIRYKWSLKDLKSVVDALNTAYAQSIIPMNYYTPPYLIAEPEVRYHRLSSKDKFMVLATDGLWEMLPSEQVVRLVGEHMEGRETEDRYVRDDQGLKLGDLNALLKKRKMGLSRKARDQNAGTHLIRHALGLEHRKVSEMLTFPPYISRYYRDDITVIVVYFDSNYIANNEV